MQGTIVAVGDDLSCRLCSLCQKRNKRSLYRESAKTARTFIADVDECL